MAFQLTTVTVLEVTRIELFSFILLINKTLNCSINCYVQGVKLCEKAICERLTNNHGKRVWGQRGDYFLFEFDSRNFIRSQIHVIVLAYLLTQGHEDLFG